MLNRTNQIIIVFSLLFASSSIWASVCTNDLYAQSPMIDPSDPNCFLLAKAAILNGMDTAGCETSTSRRYCKVKKDCPNEEIGDSNSSQSDSSSSNSSNFGSLDGVRATYPVPQPVNSSIISSGISVAYGAVNHVESDYQGNSIFPLNFNRYYNSATNIRAGSFGKQWRHSYDRTVVFKQYGQNYVIVAHRPNGTTNKYDVNGGSDVDVTDTLELVIPDQNDKSKDRWHYVNTNEELEEYDVPGPGLLSKLLSITSQSGLKQEFNYNSDGKLESITEPTGKSLGFTYNAKGLLETLTASGNRIWQYQYDSLDRLEKVTLPDLTTTQYHYEKANMPYGLTGVTDQRNIRYITYDYNGSDQGSGVYYGQQKKSVTINYTSSIRTIKNSNNIESSYTLSEQNNTPLITNVSGPGCTSCSGSNAAKVYDTNNNLTSLTQYGITTEWGDYDTNRNPGYRIDAVGTPEERRTDYEYDPRFRSKVTKITVASVSLGKNKETILVYNDEGQLIEQTRSGFTPSGTVVSQKATFQYTGPLKQLSLIDGPRINVTDVTTLEYYADIVSAGDNRARLKKITLPNNIVIANNIQYTPTGLVKQISNTNEVVTQYDYYTGNERLKTITEKKELQTRKTQWTYLPSGNVEAISIGFGTSSSTTLTFNYDDARRLTSINDADGNEVSYILDDEGNPETTNTKDKNGNLTHTLSQTFDDYNRLNLLTRTHANMDYDFDTSGTLNQLKNGKQVATEFGYDDLQRLAQVIQDPSGLNFQSLYQYDNQDNLVLIQDPKGNATTYEYDDLGNLLSVTSPDTGETTYQHDSAGNIFSQTNAKNQTILYAYDALNRLKQLDASGTEEADLTYQYDSSLNGVGHLASITHAQGKTEWDYTPFGEIAEKRESLGTSTLTTNYVYDASGQLTETTYPSSLKITNQYTNGVIAALKVDGQPLLNNIKHEPFGGVTGWIWSNNTAYSRQYLDSGLLKTFSLGSDSRSLEYDEATNINQLDDSQQQLTVVYDNINRLTDISGGEKSYGYQYDANGNRKQYKENNSNYNYTLPPSNNRLQAVEGPITKNYQYDDNGNVQSDGIHTYTYNSQNRLIAVNNGAMTYIHNGLGQRVEKNPGGSNNIANSITTTTLLQDNFTGSDGKVIDDQSGGLWQGGPWKFGVSAKILNNQAAINAKKALFAISSITDNGNNTTIKATINRGLIQLKGITKKENIIAVDYDGIETVNIKVGNQWWTKRQVLKTLTLPQGNTAIGVSINLKAGIVRVVIIDNGETIDTGDLDSKILKTGESYQLQIKTIKIDGQFTDMLVDNVDVTSTSSGGDSNTGATYFSYNSRGQLLGEYFSDGQVVQETVYLGRLPVAVVKDGFTYFIHADQLGAPRLITDTAGTAVWSWSESEPFGNEDANEDPDNDGTTFTYNLRFPGQYFDAETGLHYNYFRDYDTSTGQYIESDPIGLAGGLNTFGYVFNNPISFIDPWGLFNLSEGYTGRVDSFEYNGESSFEIHVYDPNGKEVGVHGPKGWINKHGHVGNPEGLSNNLCDAVKGKTIDELRKRNRFPDKGTVNIKDNKWKYFVKFGGSAAVVGNIQSNLSIEKLCGMDPTHDAC